MYECICDAVQATGAVPPGNARNSPQQWVRKTPRAKPELKLTPGKGLQDLTCSVEDLLDSVVKTNKVCQLLSQATTALASCLKTAFYAALWLWCSSAETAAPTCNIRCRLLCSLLCSLPSLHGDVVHYIM